MMKRLLLFFLMSFVGLHAAGQTDSDFDAIVLDHDEVFFMQSESSGTLKVSRRVMVMNSRGVDAATFDVYTDSFRKLSSFSGRIVSSGKTLKKLRESDLNVTSAAEGGISDAYVEFYVPNAPYPFTVEYEYTVSYSKGFINFPVFMPVTDPLVSVQNASYVLNLPAQKKISFVSEIEDTFVSEGGRDVYEWRVEGFKGYKSEHMMPGIDELVPYVIAEPVDFEYAGTVGSQGDWVQSGSFLYGLMSGKDEIPAELKEKVASMTSGLTDDKSKIKVLYDYLRANTRYVSVQLGIGGMKPFPVADVAKKGFGDCKALTRYMQALLDLAGISSYYTVLDTDDPTYHEGLYTVGQMNHAMLCVPLQQDTLWIECTNPRLPLGYRHRSLAGHDVLLIKESGGELVRVKEYADTLHFQAESIDVILDSDGSASCKGIRHLKLDNVESYLGFQSLDPKRQFDMILSSSTQNPAGFKILSVENNFDGWLNAESDYCPEMKIGYSFEVKDYGKVTGDRIFMQLNPFAKQMYSERSQRVNDFVCTRSRTICDTIRITVPKGYAIESVPESSVVESRYGTFVNSVKVLEDADDVKIISVQKLVLNPVREPAENYKEYSTFARNVSKAYSFRIVLKKQ